MFLFRSGLVRFMALVRVLLEEDLAKVAHGLPGVRVIVTLDERESDIVLEGTVLEPDVCDEGVGCCMERPGGDVVGNASVVEVLP